MKVKMVHKECGGIILECDKKLYSNETESGKVEYHPAQFCMKCGKEVLGDEEVDLVDFEGDSVPGIRISMEVIFLKFAELVAQRSTCKRQQNGAILVSPDYLHIWGFGYNGSARKTPHNCTNEVGNCSCVHAELNALLKAGETKGGILFCTTSPCMDCARAILNAEISKVFYKNEYRIPDAIQYLDTFGVECHQMVY